MLTVWKAVIAYIAIAIIIRLDLSHSRQSAYSQQE